MNPDRCERFFGAKWLAELVHGRGDAPVDWTALGKEQWKALKEMLAKPAARTDA